MQLCLKNYQHNKNKIKFVPIPRFIEYTVKCIEDGLLLDL